MELALAGSALEEQAKQMGRGSFHSSFWWRKGKVQCISVYLYKLHGTTSIPTTTQFAIRPSPDSGTQPPSATSSKQQWMNGKAWNDVNGLCGGQWKYVGALHGFILIFVARQLQVISFLPQTEYNTSEFHLEPCIPFRPLVLALLEEWKFLK